MSIRPGHRRTGIQLAIPFEERRITDWKFRWSPPFIIQPKLDGRRCRALIGEAGADVMLLSSEGNILTKYPHIEAALRNSGLKNTELDGELYRHGLSFEQICSDEYAGELQFHNFDIVSSNAQIIRTMELEKLEKLKLFGDEVQIVKSEVVTNLEGIMRMYQKYIDQGYEGFILRDMRNPYERKRTTRMMKFKPRKDDYYKIIDTFEEFSMSGEQKGRLGGVICIDDMGTGFRVGSGFTFDQRVELWKIRESLPGKYCHVKYQRLTEKNRVPAFPIFSSIVEMPI